MPREAGADGDRASTIATVIENTLVGPFDLVSKYSTSLCIGIALLFARDTLARFRREVERTRILGPATALAITSLLLALAHAPNESLAFFAPYLPTPAKDELARLLPNDASSDGWIRPGVLLVVALLHVWIASLVARKWPRLSGIEAWAGYFVIYNLLLVGIYEALVRVYDPWRLGDVGNIAVALVAVLVLALPLGVTIARRVPGIAATRVPHIVTRIVAALTMACGFPVLAIVLGVYDYLIQFKAIDVTREFVEQRADRRETPGHSSLNAVGDYCALVHREGFAMLDCLLLTANGGSRTLVIEEPLVARFTSEATVVRLEPGSDDYRPADAADVSAAIDRDHAPVAVRAGETTLLRASLRLSAPVCAALANPALTEHSLAIEGRISSLPNHMGYARFSKGTTFLGSWDIGSPWIDLAKSACGGHPDASDR